MHNIMPYFVFYIITNNNYNTFYIAVSFDRRYRFYWFEYNTILHVRDVGR